MLPTRYALAEKVPVEVAGGILNEGDTAPGEAFGAADAYRLLGGVGTGNPPVISFHWY